MRALIGSLIRITEVDPRSAYYGQRDDVVGMLGYYGGTLRKYPKFARFKFRVIRIKAHPLWLALYKGRFADRRAASLQNGTTIAATYEVVTQRPSPREAETRREPCLPS